MIVCHLIVLTGQGWLGIQSKVAKEAPFDIPRLRDYFLYVNRDANVVCYGCSQFIVLKKLKNSHSKMCLFQREVD